MWLRYSATAEWTGPPVRDVVAPSLIPRKPGERIQTDRRDANKLPKLHRAGELTPVWIPDQKHEATRDLIRAWHAAAGEQRRARQQLASFVLRHGHSYSRTSWGRMHRRWMASLKFDQPTHCLVLEDAIATVESAQERHQRGRTPTGRNHQGGQLDGTPDAD